MNRIDPDQPVGVGIVGCGRIAGLYAASLATKPEKARLIGGCDAVPDRAEQLMRQHGGRAFETYEQMLDDPAVQIVVNLTVQQAHAGVTEAALRAGRHVHSEKPLATTREDARSLLELAEQSGLRLTCSPFTFMGEAQRILIDAAQAHAVGRPLVAYAEMNHGPIERWNPRPIPFLQPGAGPLLDVGIYAVTILTAALGSVGRVTGFGHIVQPRRTIRTGPDQGKTFTVTTPDQVVAGLEFTSGAVGRVTASFRSGRSKQANGIEIHGERGTLFLPSCFEFNAEVEQFDHEEGAWSVIPHQTQPFAGLEWGRAVFDLADALREGRSPQSEADRAYHVLDVCLSILESAEQGQRLEVQSRIAP